MWNTTYIFVLYILYFYDLYHILLTLTKFWICGIYDVCVYVCMYVYMQEWFKFNILLWQNHNGGICVNVVACKSVLCDQIAIVPACWLNCVQTDNIFFLALVTHEYWSVITCHEIWQNWQGGLGMYAHHLWEIFT